MTEVDSVPNNYIERFKMREMQMWFHFPVRPENGTTLIVLRPVRRRVLASVTQQLIQCTTQNPGLICI